MAAQQTPVGVALFGYEAMGAIHAENIFQNPRTTLLYVVGTNQAKVDAFVAKYPGTKGSINADQVFADSAVGAVVISSASPTHYELIQKAVRAKKHVLVEKPLVFGRDSKSQVVALFDEAKANGVTLITGFQRRFDRNFRTLKAKIDQGAIGAVEVVRIISRDPSNNPEPFIDQRAPNQEAFINAVYDSLIHDFDMAQWLVGEEHSQLFITNPHPESVTIQLKYPSGILLSINWAKSMKYGYDQRVEVFGETGLLAVENEKNSSVVHFHSNGSTTDSLNSFFPSRYEHAYQDELNHLLDVAYGNAAPLITPEQSIRSASLADEAVRFVESFREDAQKASAGQSAALAVPFGEISKLQEEIASPQRFPTLSKDAAPLRIVLVGAGRMGMIRGGSIATHPRMKLVAVADPFLENAKTLGASLKVPAFATLKEALAEGADAVWISASTPSHLELITEAAKAKKHIYCEKPIGLTVEEIDKAFKVAHDEGVYLLCGWMRRFDAGYASVFDATQTESFGKPFILNCVNGDHPLPPVQVMASLGSIYHDLMVHDIDTCTYFTKEVPVSVYATGNTFISELKPAGVLDGGALVFTYPSGATAVISARRRSVIGYDQRVEVVGRGGLMATLNNYVQTPVAVAKGPGTELGKINYSFPDRFAQAYATEVDHFARVLFDGELPRSNYRECRQVAIICDAALKSFQEGKAVVLPSF